jgi:hypothetical protein
MKDANTICLFLNVTPATDYIDESTLNIYNIEFCRDYPEFLFNFHILNFINGKTTICYKENLDFAIRLFTGYTFDKHYKAPSNLRIVKHLNKLIIKDYNWNDNRIFNFWEKYCFGYLG